jgi:hypothetical protein
MDYYPTMLERLKNQKYMLYAHISRLSGFQIMHAFNSFSRFSYIRKGTLCADTVEKL